MTAGESTQREPASAILHLMFTRKAKIAATEEAPIMLHRQLPTIIRLGHVGGLDLSLVPSALWSIAAVWIGFSMIGIWLLGFSPWEALLGGLFGVVIHWLSDFLHQYGHAIVARHAGYPMTGLVSGVSSAHHSGQRTKPSLPGRIHIRRALGGPIASIFARQPWPWPSRCCLASRQAWPGGWQSSPQLTNLILLGFGAFLPLGFTDGQHDPPLVAAVVALATA